MNEQLMLSMPQWKCGECGAKRHFDINTTINIAAMAT
ncbi:hypothetical protein [Photorhabdus akhurstii]